MYNFFKLIPGKKTLRLMDKEPATFLKSGPDAIPVAYAATMFDEILWKDWSPLQQLQLALFLTGKALPVWSNFTSVYNVSYQATSNGASTRIATDLLQKAVEEIKSHAQLYFPDVANATINQYYNNFVDPVIALHDGLWTCPYPVKKIFLAVYFLLKSIVEQNNPTEKESLLSKAINAALDCLELSKLYNREQWVSIINAYCNRMCTRLK